MAMTTPKQGNGGAPGEIEALIPWRAVGVLAEADARRLDAAAAADPALAAELARAREEAAQTIALNETLHGPSHAGFEALMRAIDAEERPRPRAGRRGGPGWLALVADWLGTPRGASLAMAAAAVMILAQAGLVGALLLRDGAAPGQHRTASADEKNQSGQHVLVAFSPTATAQEINGLLLKIRGNITSGPKAGGVYRIEFIDTPDGMTTIMNALRESGLVTAVLPGGHAQ